MAKPTIKSLQAEIATLRQRSDSNYENGAQWKAKAETAEASLKESRSHFADLKERLSNSEMENQRLRGYIARVQEDDTVREELVTVGEPDGEQRMVPKRKPTVFERPSDFSEPRNHNQELSDFGFGRNPNRDRKPPRHWITY